MTTTPLLNAGSREDISDRTLIALTIVLIMAPWAAAKAILVAGLLAALSVRLDRGLRLTRKQIGAGLGALGLLSLVISPYWSIAPSPLTRALGLLATTAVVFAWVRHARASIDVAHVNPSRVPWVVATLMLVIYGPTLSGPLEFRGDEDLHMTRPLRALQALAAIASPHPFLVAIALTLAVFVVTSRTTFGGAIRRTVLWLVAVVAGIVFVIIPLAPDMQLRLARYPALGIWLRAALAFSPFDALTALRGVAYEEALYRLAPFASAVVEPADAHPGAAQWPMGFIRTPGYPLFAGAVLTLTGGSIAALILAQMALSLVAITLAYQICNRLLGVGAARIAATALALDPATIVYTNLLQPESLFIVMLLACVLFWMKALRDLDLPSALAAGALAGMATLTRPIGILLPLPLLAIALCSQASGRRKTLLFVAATLSSSLLVGGWMARNAALTGVPFLSSIEGVNLLYYRAAGALAAEQGRDIEDVRHDLLKELNRRIGSNPNPGIVSREQSRFGMEVLKAHPWGALRSAADGVLHLAAGTGLTALSGLRGDPEPERVAGFAEQTLQFVFTALLVGLYAGALRGLWKLARARDFASLSIALSFIAYFVVMSAGPEATTRFRVPITPFLAMLAGAGFSTTPLRSSRSTDTA